MPVYLNSDHREGLEPCVTVGLINNMPDEALKATERQFISLLSEASGGIPVRLSLYTLPGVPRNQASHRHMNGLYSDIEGLWDSQLDGLIVTGREPLAERFEDEPYWGSFTRLVDWAKDRTHSTIWSCLAAHAAVFYMDGIERVKRKEKLFGVFQCSQVANHPLMATSAITLQLPHSRWNGLRQKRLNARGYTVLTQTADGEIDAFVKQQESLFVFFQSHPEYEAGTLLREYRRDIGRFFRGDSALYPSMPQNYFSASTRAAVDFSGTRALYRDSKIAMEEISLALDCADIAHTWRSHATNIYSNWFGCLLTNRPTSGKVAVAAALAPVL